MPPSVSPAPSGFPPRGDCQHPECLGDPLGSCAFFAVTDNNIPRAHALHPEEVCHQCGHLWFHHQAKTAEAQSQPRNWARGGCPSSACGGFLSLDPPDSWGYTSLCVCGRLLRAHGSPPLSLGLATGASSAAPPQFATTHPTAAAPTPFVPSGLPSLLGGAGARPASSSTPMPPPLTAYMTMRGPDQGPVNDQRLAASARHGGHPLRRPVPADMPRGALSPPPNLPRSRTTVASVPAGPHTDGGAVLQLHPHHAAPPSAVATAMSSRAGSSAAAVAASSSSGSSSTEAGNTAHEIFSVLMFPFVPPVYKRRANGTYPHSSIAFHPADFKNVVESLEHWGLLFSVRLSRTGSVFRSLGTQVITQLDSFGIELPGYDRGKSWTAPQDLPFVLLNASNKKDDMKLHSPYDSFNEEEFTHASLTGKKPNLVGISCPVGGPLMKHRFLRLAPRFGDLRAPLNNHAAFVAGAPGLQDLLSIEAPEPPHPCFPHRVLSHVVEELTAKCLVSCPVASRFTPPGSPTLTSADIAAPAPVVARPRPRPVTRSSASLPPPIVIPSAPSAPRELDLDDTDEVSTASPQSPASFLATLSQSRGLVEPLFLAELPGNPASLDPTSHMDVVEPQPGVTAHGQVDLHPTAEVRHEVAANAVPMPDSNAHRARTSVRMSTGGRAPRARVVAPADSSDSEMHDDTAYDDDAPYEPPRGSRRTHSDIASPETPASVPPSNRRRVEGPQPGQVGVRAIPARPSVCTEPLQNLGKRELAGWSDRVISGIPPASSRSLVSHNLPGLRPKIRAADVKQGASILIFMVEWLFTHAASGPLTSAQRGAFEVAFRAEYPAPEVECDLVPLTEIMRHAHHLDVEVEHALGDSPIRSILRQAIHTVSSQRGYWQPLGRYNTITWFLQRAERQERDVALRTSGFLSLLHLVVLLVGPDPISPFALLNILLGRVRSCRYDEHFMMTLDPELVGRLQVWKDFDISQPLPRDPNDPLYHLLVAAEIDPWKFGDGPLQACDLLSVEQDLVSQMVHGKPVISDDELDMVAFADGFFAAHPRRSRLLESFRGFERDYIAAMCNQRLEDVGVLLSHLEFIKIDEVDMGFEDDVEEVSGKESGSSVSQLPDSVWDAYFESEFEDALRYYLTQSGHPDHPTIRSMVGDRFQDQAEDPLLRARLFLTMMSGSDLVPIEPAWKIKIHFVHTGTRCPDPSLEVEAVPRAIQVQACFFDCAITMDDGLRALLRLKEAEPWLSFQVWFHGAVLDPDDFNQA